jgi:Polysaccharide deacetylase
MRLLAVNHHYYRESAPESGIYPITPAAFDDEIALLAKSWQIASQDATIEALSLPQSSVALCLITFDDGLKEQMAAARRLAVANHGGVFFVSTAPLVERRILEVHKLHMIRSLRSDAEIASALQAIYGKAFSNLDLDVARRQYRYDDDQAAQVKYFMNFVLDLEARQKWSDQAFVELFGDEAAAASQLYMNADDVRELARLGMLGTHGHSHRPLAELDDSGLRNEIQLSLGILAELGATNIRGISYPYGGPSAVDERVVKAAIECGLTYGLTMTRGINAGDSFLQPMLLKRISTNDHRDYC